MKNYLNMKNMFALLVFAFAGMLIISTIISAKTISLNGTWKFAVDTAGTFNIDNVSNNAAWRDAKVPLSWQVQFPELRDYQGVAWYKKSVDFNGMKSNESATVKFEAVDYIAEVYINGKLAGKHEGGYTPFEFDISSLLKQGSNEIILRIVDPQTNDKGTEGLSYWNIPHGKQNWYVQTGGIWRDAEIEIGPKKTIKNVHITPLIDGHFSADIFLSPEEKKTKNESLTLIIYDPSGYVVFKKTSQLTSDDNKTRIEGSVKDPVLWNLDTPKLYKLELTLNKDIKFTDNFGFRSFEAKDKKLYLNGKPFYMIAALDQDFYPETMYTATSEEYIRDEMIKAKKIGLNMLRCHIKVPDRRYLKIADELGLLVWYEIPNWDVFSTDAAKRGMQTFDDMLFRDWNHPSLVVISLINESWGIDLQKQDQREWLKSAFILAKQKAPGRLIVDNSACWGNFHIKTDINDYHTYYAIPENRQQFMETVSSVAGRPDWLFSKFGDAEQKGDEPLLISEFGNWGLPKLPDKLPFWFNRQFLDDYITMPDGVYKRFSDFHYNEIFKSYNDLAEESQKAQLDALKFEIEQIRLSPEIQGYVITEFTDINWESNGLMDMWRNLKVSANNLSDIQQKDVLIPRPEKYTYWSNENAKINLWLSHYSDEDLEGSTLHWESSDHKTGDVSLSQLKQYDVSSLPAVTVPLSSSNNIAEKVKVNFSLKNKDGKVIAKNWTEVFIYPKVSRENISLSVYDPKGTLKDFSKVLADKGYSLSNNQNSQNKLVITNELDNEVIQKLNNGSNVICLIDTMTNAPAGFPFKFKNRRTSDWYDGNWASNLNWIRNQHQVLKGITFGRSLGFESAHSSPQVVITDITSENFSDVLAGMYIGWLHLNSGYIVQTKAGNGRLILCTVPLAQTLGSDPFAVKLFENLVKYSIGNDFNPQLSLNIK